MSNDRAKAFSEQAHACLRSGRYDDAVQFARQALELHPTPTAFALLGAALSQSEKPDEANDAFERAAKLEPNSAQHQYNLAANCYRFGWKGQAAKFAKLALSLDPNHPKAKNLADRLERENQVAKTVYNPDLSRPSAPIEPPVIGTELPGAQSPVWAYKPPVIQLKHTIQKVERMGRSWDALLWSIYSLQVILFIPIYTSFLKPIVEQDSSQFFDFGSGGALPVIALLVWIALTVLWTIDMVDRRPSGGYLVLAAFGIIFTLPLLFSCMAPVLGIFIFPIYIIGTRSGSK